MANGVNGNSSVEDFFKITVQIWGTGKDDCLSRVGQHVLENMGSADSNSWSAIQDKYNEIRDYNNRTGEEKVRYDDTVYEGQEILVPIEDAIEGIGHHIEDLKEGYNQIKSDLSDDYSELAKLNANASTANTNLEKALKEYNTYQNHPVNKNKVKVAYDKALSAYDDAIKAVEDKKAEIEEKEEKLRDTEEEMRTFREDLSKYTDKKDNEEDKIDKDLKEIVGYIEDLDEELQQAQDDLDKLLDEFDKYISENVEDPSENDKRNNAMFSAEYLVQDHDGNLEKDSDSDSYSVTLYDGSTRTINPSSFANKITGVLGSYSGDDYSAAEYMANNYNDSQDDDDKMSFKDLYLKNGEQLDSVDKVETSNEGSYVTVTYKDGSKLTYDKKTGKVVAETSDNNDNKQGTAANNKAYKSEFASDADLKAYVYKGGSYQNGITGTKMSSDGTKYTITYGDKSTVTYTKDEDTGKWVANNAASSTSDTKQTEKTTPEEESEDLYNKLNKKELTDTDIINYLANDQNVNSDNLNDIFVGLNDDGAKDKLTEIVNGLLYKDEDELTKNEETVLEKFAKEIENNSESETSKALKNDSKQNGKGLTYAQKWEQYNCVRLVQNDSDFQKFLDGANTGMNSESINDAKDPDYFDDVNEQYDLYTEYKKYCENYSELIVMMANTYRETGQAESGKEYDTISNNYPQYSVYRNRIVTESDKYNSEILDGTQNNAKNFVDMCKEWVDFINENGTDEQRDKLSEFGLI